MKVLGLTGGIGSGKTTVARIFQEQGIPVFIADEEGKFLMQNNPVVQNQITDIFGLRAYKDGILDRKFIASKVFSDPKKLKALNLIVHPAVARLFEEWKKEQNSPYVVYEAAILFETGGDQKCDFTLLITAPHSEKIKRIQSRDNATSEEIEARMKNQWPDEKKAPLATFQIENIDLPTTRKKVLELHQNLLQTA